MNYWNRYKYSAGEYIRPLREFWYSKNPGVFHVKSNEITRQEIDTYGGPSPEYNCAMCQEIEWMSRIYQHNYFEGHVCKDASYQNRCKNHSARQGNELWTHYHQNHWFASMCDTLTNAPRGLLVHSPKGEEFIYGYNCDQSTKVFLRMLARACQYDVVVGSPKNIDWSRYDFVMVFIDNGIYEFTTPLPVIAYMHDLWKKIDIRQARLNYYNPEFIFTPYPSALKALYKIPKKSKIHYRCLSASQFFTRPNLSKNKPYNLISIGVFLDSVYAPRAALTSQIRELDRKYRIQYHHRGGAARAYYMLECKTPQMSFLNKWSEVLGSGHYVIFGNLAINPQPVFQKHFECLGSGAIPIMPDSPDLKPLGIKPMVHFIPVSQVMNNNAKLRSYLNSPQKYRHIAENAVRWHEENADKLLFNSLGELVQEATNHKYQRILV